MTDFWRELGVKLPPGPFEEVMRVRLDDATRRELDRVEAYIRGSGYREVSRSDLIRAAVFTFVEGFREAVPEIATITLPEERDGRRDKAKVE